MQLPSYRNDNENSKISALMATHNLKSAQAQVILEALLVSDSEGRTAQELEMQTGLKGDSIRPRLLGLNSKGIIKRSGVSRMTKSLRPAEVWLLNLNDDFDII